MYLDLWGECKDCIRNRTGSNSDIILKNALIIREPWHFWRLRTSRQCSILSEKDSHRPRGAEQLFFVSPFSLPLLWAVARIWMEEDCADRPRVEGMKSLLEKEHAILKDRLSRNLKRRHALEVNRQCEKLKKLEISMEKRAPVPTS